MTERILAAVQMDAVVAPVTARLGRAEVLLRQATADGAELVVLPELFNVGYSYASATLNAAEGLDGVTARWMERLAKELGVLPSAAEPASAALRQSCVPGR